MPNNKPVVRNMVIENAKIIFRNFAGKEQKFNPAGRRNFCVVIDNPEFAAEKKAEGWNIKELRSRDPEEPNDFSLQVEVRYSYLPPKIWLISGKNKTELTEETVSCLDYAEIQNADVVIRPHVWEDSKINGYRVKAYLKDLYITVAEDELAKKYESYDSPLEDEDCPF